MLIATLQRNTATSLLPVSRRFSSFGLAVRFPRASRLVPLGCVQEEKGTSVVADALLEIHSWVVLVANGLAVVADADDVDTLWQCVQHLLQTCTLRLSQLVAVQ